MPATPARRATTRLAPPLQNIEAADVNGRQPIPQRQRPAVNGAVQQGSTDGVHPNHPSRSVKPPLKWQEWQANDYLALSKALERSFDFIGFTAARGRFTEEDVRRMVRASVTRPLRLLGEKRRIESGMRELAKYFDTHDKEIRTWCSGVEDGRWRVRGQLREIKDRHVLVAFETGQDVYGMQIEEGIVMIPTSVIVKSREDLQYLADTLSAEDKATFRAWIEILKAESEQTRGDQLSASVGMAHTKN